MWSMGSLVHWNLYGTIYRTLNLLFVLKCFFFGPFFALWIWAHEFLFGFIYTYLCLNLWITQDTSHFPFWTSSLWKYSLDVIEPWMFTFGLYTVPCSYSRENCMNSKICKHLSSARFIFYCFERLFKLKIEV